MLVDETKYTWKKWQQPVFEAEDTWGMVSATSTEDTGETPHEPYMALDGDSSTRWVSGEITGTATFTWVFGQPLKIYRIELENDISPDSQVTKEVRIYADEDRTEKIISGTFPEASEEMLALEPDEPFSCDCIVLDLTSYSQYVGLSQIRLIAEIGEEKAVLVPFLNTVEDMTYVSNGYNDDGTYTTVGMETFKFNGVSVQNLYISSNHWIGFGVSTEQLKVLRRDGCSTAIYRQEGELSNGLGFLKIRFEGYTVYSNRVESNRLIFELFLLSNNDMFLNVVQTPTSSNTGTSEMVCNGRTTALSLADGSGGGGGTMVSFYHLDDDGYNWKLEYGLYEAADEYAQAFLLKSDGTYYTIESGKLAEIPVENLTAAIFLKYGFEEIPPTEILTTMENPEIFLWKSGGDKVMVKDTVTAYPYPQTLESIIDMSHISIIGIKLITAEYSGEVTVRYSLDDGQSFSEEVPLGDWLNIEPDELYGSLPESKVLIMHFILHDNAKISRFKITYIN